MLKSDVAVDNNHYNQCKQKDKNRNFPNDKSILYLNFPIIVISFIAITLLYSPIAPIIFSPILPLLLNIPIIPIIDSAFPGLRPLQHMLTLIDISIIVHLTYFFTGAHQYLIIVDKIKKTVT
jgi:hypothetical protein